MRLALATAAALLAAVPASAQIYSWVDDEGRLVVSNTRRPPDGASAKVYTVPDAPSVRATRPVLASRGQGYHDLIDEHARLNGVRPDLVRAVMQVESGFNPRARSPKGAMGLMQLMPATAREFGVLDAFNPVENVRAGVAYLRQLLDRYNRNEQLALAAYNAGPAAVSKYGEAVPPYRETRRYVLKVKEIAGTSGKVPGTKIYAVPQIVDGRQVVKYTDKKPQ